MSSPSEQERLKALRNYKILDTLPEASFDRLTELASIICQTPISLISLLEEDRQWFKSKKGLEASETPRSVSFCQHAIAQNQLFEIEDATKDDRFRENPLVIGEPHIRFYAGFPLIDSQGNALGTLCVLDRTSRKLSIEQQKALALLSQEVIANIVTKREAMERNAYTHLVFHSQDLISVVDEEGRYKAVNPSFVHLMGKDEKVILSHSFFEFVHPEDLAQAKEMWNMRQERASFFFTLRFLSASKGYRLLDGHFNFDAETAHYYCMARDITESRALEEKRKKMSDFQHVIFNGTSYAIIATDTQGLIMSFNKGAEDLLGYKAKELIGKSSPALFHDPQEVEERSKQISKELGVHIEPGFEVFVAKSRKVGADTNEWRYLHKDGSIKSVELTITTLRNIANEITGYLGVAKDITEHKKAEKELSYAKDMLKTTFDTMSEGIVIQDNQASILSSNPSAERILGLTADQMAGRTSIDPLWRCVHEDGSPFPGDTHPAMEALRTGQSIHGVTMGVFKPDGSLSWININADLLEAGQGVVCTFTDITLRKQAEAAVRSNQAFLKTVTDALPGMVGYWTRDLRCGFANKNYFEWFGKTPEEMEGIAMADLLGKEVMANNKPYVERVLKGEKVAFERTLVKANGEVGYTWAHYIPDEINGEVKGFYVLVSDITELKSYQLRLERTNQELELRTQQAEAANVAKSDFLANMSHEIRTPLNGVIGFIDLLLKTEMNDTQKQYMATVQQSAHLLLGVISDILDFSKIEAGKLELERENIDLIELTHQSLDMIKSQASKKGIEVVMNLSPQVPRYIWADAIRLKQVIVNLLGNAAKFTQQGEIEFRVDMLESGAKDHDYFRFSVRDTGIGIEAHNLKKIFQAFSQEDSSTTRRFGGTGLGLTISNKLLALMGSTLQVASEIGKGSTFFFDISFPSHPEGVVHLESCDEPQQVVYSTEKDSEWQAAAIEQILQLLDQLDEHAKQKNSVPFMIDAYSLKMKARETGLHFIIERAERLMDMLPSESPELHSFLAQLKKEVKTSHVIFPFL